MSGQRPGERPGASEDGRDGSRPAVVSLLLTLVGIGVGIGLVFLGARMEPVDLLGLEVRPALPMLMTYIAGMLVGRFGAGPRR